eukprot:5085538-Lingulodinium_polyedra.AAC.1
MEEARAIRAEEEGHAEQKAAIADAKRQQLVVLRGEVAAQRSAVEEVEARAEVQAARAAHATAELHVEARAMAV